MTETRRERERNAAVRCLQPSPSEEDWQEFYEALYGFVRRLASDLAGIRRNETEDMMQEAFTRIFEVIRDWDPGKASVRTYLTPIVNHVLIDYLRHGNYARARTVPLDEELQAFRARAVQNPELLERTASALVDHLGDPGRIGIIRALLRGVPAKKICSQFGVKPNNVYGARIWLKRKLKEWSHHLPPG
jgi:RNA polymerase sigma factor (sigma-70 family)